jgi:hypothetical protein
MRTLAVVHVVMASALLGAAAWWTVAMVRILPYLSTGSNATKLVTIAGLGVAFSLPAAALAGWMLMLARAAWRGDPRVRGRLLWTHTLLLVPALAAVVLGVAALSASALSAARGGGLLGAVGLVPLVFGGSLAIVNAGAIVAARYLWPQSSPQIPLH